MSYSPNLQRWTGPDPIGFAAGLTNTYVAYDNNPVNMLDPLGLESGAYTASYTQSPFEKERFEKQRMEAIRVRNLTIANWIDQKTVYTPEEKIKVKEGVLRLLNAADFEWRLPTGPFGGCEQWATKYIKDTGAISPNWRDYFKISDQNFEGTSFGLFRHNPVRFTFRDGTEFYLDDGNWGGPDHLFMPGEVPSGYKPLAIPDNWYQPDVKKHKNAYPPDWFK